MNLGSRKCCDIIKCVSKYQNISRIILYNSNKLASLQPNLHIKRKIHQIHFSRTFLIDKQVSQLFPRFYADYPPHKVITLPNLSPTMETGSVLSWGRKEGEAVSEGDLLAEIETDKATMSMDASDTGIMAKILVAAGTKDIPIGTPLCVIVENESDVAAFKDFTVSATPPSTQSAAKPESSAPPAPSPPKPAAVTPQPMPISSVSSSPADRIFVSPYAKTLATERNIDLTTAGIVGSGPDGRIRARDLDQVSAASAGLAARQVSSAASYSDIELSNMRKVIAQRLCLSKQTIPHYYLTMDVRMDRVIEMRHKINKKNTDKSATGSKISVNDFVIKAAAVACMRVLQCNSSWQETFIRQYNQVDVSVAVATPNGLITPIVFNAQSKGLREINSDVTLLAVKARENKLQPKEFQGGTFTVSNLGMYGITNFSAIINPPQACILAVGGSQERLVHNDKSDIGFSRATYMSVTLCCDHRVVDGAVGAQWLMEFRDNMEDPANMLL